MPYIERNSKGEIIGMFQTQDNDKYQWLEVTHPEILDYVAEIEKTTQARQALTTTDTEMVRVVEDLIDLLMEKQIFVFTELPVSVQEKLNLRKQLRKNLNTLESPINEDDAIF